MARLTGVQAFVSLLFLVLVTAISGCRDAEGGDPLAVVLTEETRGALSLEVSLPSLPGLVARTDAPDSSVAREWNGRWEASWLMEPSVGRDARRAIYDEAVGPLSRSLGPEGVGDVLRAAEEAADAAAAAALVELPRGYRERVEEARSVLIQGRAALQAGETTEALRAALRAADGMRAVSPESVARILLARAQGGLGDRSDVPLQRRARIDRLIRGAEAALEDGEYRRAIHRAYYACRLLDVRLP